MTQQIDYKAEVLKILPDAHIIEDMDDLKLVDTISSLGDKFTARNTEELAWKSAYDNLKNKQV